MTRSVRRLLSLVLVAVAAAAPIASCGLAPSMDTTPVFSGDGIAGLEAIGPIEFCVGRARVVTPSVADGAEVAFCVDAGRKPASCGSDADCSAPEQCYCGRCEVHGCDITGRGCSKDEVCQGNRCTARCLTDSQCPQGFVCDGGGCGRPCGKDADCPYGELCDSLDSVCRVSLCDAFTSCGPGQRCEPQEQVGEMHEPFVVGSGDSERAYLALHTGTKSAIYRARLKTPERWVADPAQPVLAADAADLDQVGAPALVQSAAGLTLYFASAAGARLERATSSDGASFSRDPTPVLVADPGGWERGRVGSPSVVSLHGTTYLLYEGGQGAGIGLARMAGDQAQRVGSEPLIAPSTVEDMFWRDVTAVGTPDAIVVNGVVRIYFTGRGAEGADAVDQGNRLPSEINDSIGLVTTRDFVKLSRFPLGPVFARRTNLRAYLGEREPFVRVDGARTRLAYVAGEADGSVTGLALAAEPP